jgi:hypothetical protein
VLLIVYVATGYFLLVASFIMDIIPDTQDINASLKSASCLFSGLVERLCLLSEWCASCVWAFFRLLDLNLSRSLTCSGGCTGCSRHSVWATRFSTCP